MNGQQMALEMSEQPERLRALIARAPQIAERVRALVPEPFNGVTIVARGSSDHAAVYGRYLIEAATGKPVSLAAPSLHTLYKIPADYRGQLVIAISQSGATPEIVQTLQTLQAAGGRGLGITNEDGSPLAQSAEATIVLEMGRELAVPATKTVTGQLVAMAIIAEALTQADSGGLGLAGIPDSIEQVLRDPEPAAQVAASLVGSSQLVVAARGYMYAAALETALKIKETCYLVAEGYSVADLRHGPIAAVTSGVPVLAMTNPGPSQADVLSLADDLRARQVPVYLVAPSDGADVPLPAGIPEQLAPIAATVCGQQIAHQLALALGHDPDTPKGLNKVTMT
jgi:glutamine---fructose-6-phosphate transaminase (isomerizing)